MKTTILVTGIALAFSIAGPALADAGNTLSGITNSPTVDTTVPDNSSTIAVPLIVTGTSIKQTAIQESEQEGFASVQANDGSTAYKNSNNTDNSTTNKENNNVSGKSEASSYGAAASGNGVALSNYSNAFNTNKAIASVKLEGEVSHNHVSHIGNMVSNKGDANGARGGSSGRAVAGNARNGEVEAGKASTGEVTSIAKNTAGKGGEAEGAMSMGGRAKATTGPAVALSGQMATGGEATSGAKGGSADAGNASIGLLATGRATATGGAATADPALATGGTNLSQTDATSGNSTANGGAAGAASNTAGTGGNTGNATAGPASSGDALSVALGGNAVGGNANSGDGGNGGNGGRIALNAGTFDMSNMMSSVSNSAAGIMTAVQNSGINALVQTAVNVQANLGLGK